MVAVVNKKALPFHHITTIKYTYLGDKVYTITELNTLRRDLRIQRPALTEKDIDRIVENMEWQIRYEVHIGYPPEEEA